MIRHIIVYSTPAQRLVGYMRCFVRTPSDLPGWHDDLMLQASLNLSAPSPERNAPDDDRIVCSLFCSALELALQGYSG